jgi:hypothetical protein
MPIATVQLPNGKIADIEVPQGATPQEIESFVMGSPEFGGQQEMQPQAQPMQSPEELLQIAKKQAYLKENLPATQGIAGLSTIENVGRGLNLGLGNAAIGAFQAATDVGEKAARLIERIYYGDNLKMNTIGNRLANEVKQTKELQAELPLAQKTGIAIGEAVPYLTTGVGTGAKVAQVAGKVAGLATGGAIGGAVSSAFSPQEQSGLENRAIETLKGGAIGATVGAGLGIAGKIASNVKTSAVQLGKDVLAGYKAKPTEAIAGFTSKPVETLDSISKAIKEGSSNAYKAMRESGAVLKPETTKSIFMNIDNSLEKSGILNLRLHGDTIGVLSDIKALASKKNEAIGLEELDQYRQILGDVVKKNTDISGKINSDALKANIAINKLDDVVENLGGNAIQGGEKKSLDLLNTAREEWKRYRKFDAITNIVRKADGDPNRTKTLLQNFVNNPKNLRGFLPVEVEALKRAKTNSTAEGLMKAVGKFGFDIGSGRNAGNSALPIGSILIGGGTGGLTALVGTVARQAQKLSARGQVDDVLKLIQGQEPQIASKVVQKLPAKTRDYVLTNILTQTINK